MAVPSNMSVLNLSGKYILSKSLSDNTDEILRLQGVGWMTRKIIQVGTLYLTVKHYSDDSGIEHIDILQTLSGLSSSDEDRILDATPRPYEDDVFGKVISVSRRVKVAEIDNQWLLSRWTEDTVQESLVLTQADSDTPNSGTTWTAIQAWGFQVVKDEKRYARNIDFTGPKGEKIHARLVYDYQGPV
ncbi:uncharacterized protein FIBRA_07390 [Fibroporia radiculosa]|uniref:Uncharacterized protein n=1 Tax=Fibroporia radiculosa TaxID=599839 RepID=J4IBS7_9APHY|nr:uncharacterized protein FIBRA_07390 [Fibroporia radiculosa]CCM05181.1 predicted protein [Fibroporia radiculosa]